MNGAMIRHKYYSMRALEFITEQEKVYYHGSEIKLPVGTILKPRPGYEKRWGHTDFYRILEMYRPSDKLSHNNSVFMCDNPDDVDLAGAATEWLFTVVPLGPVQKHDMNYSSEISSLISLDHDFDSEEVMDAAHDYWAGVESPNEPLWEYLTTSAKIIKVEKY